MCKYISSITFYFLWICIPRNGMAGSWGSSIFNILRKLLTFLHSGCTSLQPQCMFFEYVKNGTEKGRKRSRKGRSRVGQWKIGEKRKGKPKENYQETNIRDKNHRDKGPVSVRAVIWCIPLASDCIPAILEPGQGLMFITKTTNHQLN